MLTSLLLVTSLALPPGFAVVPSPTEKDLRAANQSNLEWQVALDAAGAVVVTKAAGRAAGTGPKLPFAIDKANPKYTPQHVLELDEGFLVGTDQGEWGGALDHYKKDGTKVSTLLAKNTHGILLLGGDVVSLHGLNHLGLREGSVRFWKRDKGGFVSAGEKKLDSGPTCWTQAGPTVWVLTAGGLSRVTGRDVKQLLTLDLSALYPGSIVADGAGDLWAGMRYYVLHLKKKGEGFEAEWLARK